MLTAHAGGCRTASCIAWHKKTRLRNITEGIDAARRGRWRHTTSRGRGCSKDDAVGLTCRRAPAAASSAVVCCLFSCSASFASCATVSAARCSASCWTANAVAELGFQTIPQTGALVFSFPSWRRSVHRTHGRCVQRRWGMQEALFTAAQCRRSRSIKPMRHAVNCRARRAWL